MRPVIPRKVAPLHAVRGGSAARTLSDEQLIEAIERGETHLAGEIYDYLVPVVDHTLYRVLGRREGDHDDLIQIAFEQIITTLSKQSFARACSLKTWASTITSHIGLNALRSRRRERAVVDHQVDYDAQVPRSNVDPERESGARSELERIRAELADMKPAYGQAVLLHDVLGHDLAEIAAMTGVSVAAAQSRLVRGRKDLLRRLDRKTSARSKGSPR
jgi:RNA polymerase sigma-70 factor, ECF subfamily